MTLEVLAGVLHEPRFLQELPSSVRKCHVNGNLILFGKMPRLESNFRTGQITRNKKAKWLNLLTLENWTQWEEL